MQYWKFGRANKYTRTHTCLCRFLSKQFRFLCDWVHVYRTSEIQKKPVKGVSGSETLGKLRKKCYRCLPGHETKMSNSRGSPKVKYSQRKLFFLQFKSDLGELHQQCSAGAKVFTKEAVVVQVCSWWALSAVCQQCSVGAKVKYSWRKLFFLQFKSDLGELHQQCSAGAKVFTKEALVVQVCSWWALSAVFCWGQSKVFMKEALVVQVWSWWAPSALFCWGQTLCHQGSLVANLCANGEGFPWWTFIRSVLWGWDLWWISCHADLYFCFQSPR